VPVGEESPAARSQGAARQGAALFTLAGALGLLGLATQPDRAGVLLSIAIADFVVAAVCLLLPWHRWPVGRVAWVSLAAFAIMGVSTWAFGGNTGGTIPFYVLTFTWLGLHQEPRVIWWASGPATLSYVLGLVAAGAPPDQVGATAVLMPVVVAVGLVISKKVVALRAHERELREQEQWRAAMVATLAHDIRSPLTSITGALEIAEDDPATSAVTRPFIEAAARQADRITRLAAGLLDLERVEQGKLRLNPSEWDVRGLAEHVAGLIDPKLVTVEVPDGLTVVADRDRMEQVLVNLANNARRHGGGPVVIGGRREGADVVVTVRDHGPGVRDEDVPRLFTRLARGSAGTDSVGLGLWIVRTLTEAHGGSVRHENAGPGARFLVRLPQTLPLDRS
jgi:signal transduction histidine kinase